MRGSGLALCLALAACGGGRSYIKVPDVTTQPAQLDLTIDGKAHRVSVKTEGRDTVVEFLGREFVFQNKTGYRGRLSLEKVDLEVAGADVEITKKKLTVSEKGHKSVLEYGMLAHGRRIVYASGSLTAE